MGCEQSDVAPFINALGDDDIPVQHYQQEQPNAYPQSYPQSNTPQPYNPSNFNPQQQPPQPAYQKSPQPAYQAPTQNFQSPQAYALPSSHNAIVAK
jgi:hypothetical protein